MDSVETVVKRSGKIVLFAQLLYGFRKAFQNFVHLLLVTKLMPGDHLKPLIHIQYA